MKNKDLQVWSQWNKTVSEVLISKGLVLISGGAELALYLSGLGPEESKQSFLPRAVSL